MEDIAANFPPNATPPPLWVEDLPTADWYRDPLHFGRLRYWNGFGWTEQTVYVTRRHDHDAPGGTESSEASGGGELRCVRGVRRDAMRAVLFSAFGRVD